MAIVVRMTFDSADQADYDRLDAAIETGISKLGGPPDGFLVHLGHPSGDGFVTVDAWSTEDSFRRFHSEVMERALADTGLAACEPEICPLWSLARP